MPIMPFLNVLARFGAASRARARIGRTINRLFPPIVISKRARTRPWSECAELFTIESNKTFDNVHTSAFAVPSLQQSYGIRFPIQVFDFTHALRIRLFHMWRTLLRNLRVSCIQKKTYIKHCAQLKSIGKHEKTTSIKKAFITIHIFCYVRNSTLKYINLLYKKNMHDLKTIVGRLRTR